MLRAALKYAGRLRIFPLTPGLKTPLTQHGCKDASSDEDQIREWWTEYPAANIGAAMGNNSNLVALDFDCKDGKSGLQTLASLRDQFSIDTLEASTPSGGVHLFFRYPGAVLRNNVDRLPGVDVRTTGGYVVVAPSVVDCKPYRWTRKIPPADLPPGLIARLQMPKPAPHRAVPARWAPSRLQSIERARRYVDAVPGAIEGEAGDVSTYKLACRLVRGFALTDNEAMALLLSWNWRCHPAWSEAELMSKITSARRNGTEPFGARLEIR